MCSAAIRWHFRKLPTKSRDSHRSLQKAEPPGFAFFLFVAGTERAWHSVRMNNCVLNVATVDELEGGGAGRTVFAGYAESPFGSCLVAECSRGICWLSFDGADSWDALRSSWPNAELVRDDERAGNLCSIIFLRKEGVDVPLHLFVKGTEFQVKVWRTLLQIPVGETITYGQLAGMIGNPNAARSIGSAVGKNPVAFLIPCHRVVCADGSVGGYRWGVALKRDILAWEGAGLCCPDRRSAG